VKITLDTQEVDVTSLGQLDPTHVLFEADGPRLFTSRDANARTLLVYLCCEDTINALEQGYLSLRDALGQSSGWLVSTTADGHPVRARMRLNEVQPV
jgi:hypothetical protein